MPIPVATLFGKLALEQFRDLIEIHASGQN